MPIKKNSLKRKQKGGSCGLLTGDRSLQPSKPVVDKRKGIRQKRSQ